MLRIYITPHTNLFSLIFFYFHKRRDFFFSKVKLTHNWDGLYGQLVHLESNVYWNSRFVIDFQVWEWEMVGEFLDRRIIEGIKCPTSKLQEAVVLNLRLRQKVTLQSCGVLLLISLVVWVVLLDGESCFFHSLFFLVQFEYTLKYTWITPVISYLT